MNQPYQKYVHSYVHCLKRRINLLDKMGKEISDKKKKAVAIEKIKEELERIKKNENIQTFV